MPGLHQSGGSGFVELLSVAQRQLGNPSYNYLALVPNPSNSDGFDARVDHNFSSKQQVYVRYSFKNAFYSESNSAGVFAPANNFLPNVGAIEQNRSMVASYNYAITPTLVNEFRFGFANYNENDSFPIQGATAISQLGLNFDHPVGIAAHPTADAFPTFNFADGSVTNIGQDKVGTTISGNMQFTDNVTKVFGKHTLRFGFDARREHFNAVMYFAPSDDFGQFTFSGSLHRLLFWRFSAWDAKPVLLRGHWPANGCAQCPLGRLRSRYLAGKQASHGQFRIAVGTASAVCGKQWRYRYLSYVGE